jgi:hypothetical protein
VPIKSSKNSSFCIKNEVLRGKDNNAEYLKTINHPGIKGNR